jgi:hypothetical protein
MREIWGMVIHWGHCINKREVGYGNTLSTVW